MKVLLIDDDRDDQTLFGDAVRQLIPDANIAFANDGVEGLEILNSDSQLPHIVFVDINMPMIDGRETLATIRSTPSLKHLKVVMYSTSIGPDDRARFLRQGAACVVKPSNFDVLIGLLGDVLEVQNIVERNH